MLLSLCLGWILGVSMMGRSLLGFELNFIQVTTLLIIWVIIVRILHSQFKSIYIRASLTFLSFVLVFILGSAYANQSLNERLKTVEHERKTVSVIAYIKQLDQWTENSIQQPIEVLHVDGSTSKWMASIQPEKLEIAADESITLGQYYRLEGEIRPTQSYATDGAFDVEKWYIEQNIMAGFRVKSAKSLSEAEVSQLGYGRYIREQHRLSARFALKIEQQRAEFRSFLIRQPIRNKGLLLALLTGDESLLSKQTKHQFQRFGMSHLLAISGPHVVIFALMFCGALNWMISRKYPNLFLKIPRQYFLCLPFLLCVLLYCAFVGFEIPALRTLLMSALVCLALLFKQQLQPFKLLSISAALLLLFDPFSILSAAFWLSYGACFVLLRIYQTIQQQPKQNDQTWANKIYFGFKILVESQWKIFIALFPLMIIFFKQVAWISPISNLIAIPWIGLLVVPLDIVAALVFFIFEPMSSLLFQLNDLIMQLLLGILQLIDILFSPQLIPIAMNSWMLLLGIICLVILFVPRGLIPKSWSYAVLIPLILPPAEHEIQLSILDVGQGQSIFIQAPTKNMMVDTGGYYDEEKFSVGKQIILPFLSVHGVRQLDYLVLTHLDQDHSGAFESIKEKLDIKEIYANEDFPNTTSSRFQLCQIEQDLSLDIKVVIKVLSPAIQKSKERSFNKNENSCVLHVYIPNTGPYQNFLLMGDAGWQTEFELMQRYPHLKVDVLVLGHHGSHNSSSYDFLKYYQPKLAIASAGRFNRYGHPSKLTQARLKDLNIPLMTTVEQGSVHFIMKYNQFLLQTYRDQYRWLQRPKLISD